MKSLQELTPEDIILMKETNTILYDLIYRLPVRQRETICHIMRGYSYQVIALNMGISKGTVKQHYMHALKTLRWKRFKLK